MRSGTPSLLRRIGANVRALRLKKGVTQARLAEDAGYDDRFIQYVEAGRRNLTVDSLGALAAALDVPVARLFAKASTESSAKRPR
jgi:transcriptional regulator with XRE-family HTH domain